MYTLNEIFQGVRNPEKAILELNRIYNRRIRGRTGIKIMDEDWDNLLILDACRYDLFEQVNKIDGELRSVISSDSSTSGFLQYNFDGEYYPDTVYVAANPQVERHGVDGRFHDCIKLWEDCWDDELRTVRPEDVTDHALRAAEQYPNKRLIVHYIQPHYPFIGETGRQINHGSLTGDGVMKNERDVDSIWDQLEIGAVDRETVWNAYRENLELVLPDVDRLLDGVVGKSVVTSDHGNSFGTLGVYGHPGGMFLNSLVKVPWLEKSGEGRKNITRGEIGGSTSDTTVSDRLADLGYK